MGILREQRAMQVGAKSIAIDASLRAILAVVAMSGEHSTKRLCAITQIGSPTMVLKADERAVPPAERHIADTARHALTPVDRPGVEDAQPRQFRSVSGTIEAGEQLVSSADGEHGHVPLHGGANVVTFHLAQVAGDLVLLFVLAAAYEEEIICGEIHPFAEIKTGDAQRDAAPGAPLLEGENVTPVAIYVELVRVEVTQRQRKLLRHRAAPSSAAHSRAAPARPGRPA